MLQPTQGKSNTLQKLATLNGKNGFYPQTTAVVMVCIVDVGISINPGIALAFKIRGHLCAPMAP